MCIRDSYEAFCSKEAEWLDEYTLFMALKDANGGVAWSEWDDALKFRKPEMCIRDRPQAA